MSVSRITLLAAIASILCLTSGHAFAGAAAPLGAASTRDDCPIVPKADDALCCDKTSTSQGSSGSRGDASSRDRRTPRWHRYLPGMIR